MLFVFLAQMRRELRRQNEKQAAESRQNSIKIKVKIHLLKAFGPDYRYTRIFHILFCVAHAPRIRLTADQVVFHFVSGMCSFLLHFHCCHPHFDIYEIQRTFIAKNENKSSSLHCCAPSSFPFALRFSLLSLISFLNEIAHEFFFLFIYFVVVVAVVELIEPTVSATRKQLYYDLICPEFWLEQN